MLEAFKESRVPLESDAARIVAERSHRQLKSLIVGHITDAKWREVMYHAREVAERGEHEALLMRFPSGQCTDNARAIVQNEARWAETLTGEAAKAHQHWRKALASRGFDLTARILEWPGGKPGEVGLFLSWHDRTASQQQATERREFAMKTMLLLTAGGPVVILTSHASPLDPTLLDKLRVKGIRKFVAFEIPLDMAKQRYASHFAVVANDLHETDDLRVLDFDGQHAFQLFHFAELGKPIIHEGT